MFGYLWAKLFKPYAIGIFCNDYVTFTRCSFETDFHFYRSNLGKSIVDTSGLPQSAFDKLMSYIPKDTFRPLTGEIRKYL